MPDSVAPPADARPAAPAAASAAAPRRRLPRWDRLRAAEAGYALSLTLALSALSLFGRGGLSLTQTSIAEIVIVAIAAIVGATAVLAAGRRPWWGTATVLVFAAFAALSAISITWSVEPSETWIESNRLAAWLAVLCSGIAVSRLAGRWWTATLGAIVAAAVIVCGWALLTKVFPEALAADELFARLREPYEYWNSIGLTAVMGIVAATWLGARRDGNGTISALAVPAIGLLMTALLLAYSRGALLALLIALTFWFVLVPLRLRSAAVAFTGLAGGLLVGVWAFAQDTLTTDKVPAADRAASGLNLGFALLVVCLLLLLAGLWLRFQFSGPPLSTTRRRRFGVLALVIVALIPLGVAGRLAISDRGFSGSISDAWSSLTDPEDTSTVTNDPSRLTKVASVRAKYWQEAWRIYEAHTTVGVGAGGYAVARTRCRTGTLSVRHAHGFVVQTAADLGTAGLALIGLLTLCWLAAASRTLGLFGRARARLARRRVVAEPEPWTHERAGMAAMTALVVAFAVHSFVDWTWYVPGNAAVALLCAGWVAGRGPTAEPASVPELAAARVAAGARDPWRLLAAVLVVATAAVAVWSVWRPFASERAVERAQLEASAETVANRRALDDAERGERLNPLSVQPLYAQAYVHVLGNRKPQAREALVDAVLLQPGNADTWLQLADFTLNQLNQPRIALRLLGPALHLDPNSRQAQTIYLAGTRILQQRADEAAAKRAAKREAKRK